MRRVTLARMDAANDFFVRVLRHIEAQNAFCDNENSIAGGDLRTPLYEGDFATSTDASMLFEEGVNVPQEAINLTRLSVSKTLEKVMPDWAVQEWLETVLRHDDVSLLAGKIFETYKSSLAYVPVPGRRPKKFFDYRVDEKNRRADFERAEPGTAVDTANSVFSKNEAAFAGRALAQQPHVVAGVLLWQFCLQRYAHELAEHVLKSSGHATVFKTRLVAFCRFLSTSAFMLASFAALLPMAMVVYAKAKKGEEKVAPADIFPALEEFSIRGGFMKHEKPKTLPYMFNFFRRLFKKRGEEIFSPVSPRKIRVTVCSAKEALLRWAALPLLDYKNGALAACVEKAEQLEKENDAWKALCASIAGAMPAPVTGCPFTSKKPRG